MYIRSTRIFQKLSDQFASMNFYLLVLTSAKGTSCSCMSHKAKQNTAPTIEEVALKQERYILEQFSVGFLIREMQRHHKG